MTVGSLIVLLAPAMIVPILQPGQVYESIAVLPIENLSGDPQQDCFSDGLHDALITDLGQIAGFKRVIARGSAMRLKGTRTPLAQIAQALKVDALSTGAVLRSGDRVRVTAQLVDAATEAPLWAQSYVGVAGVWSLRKWQTLVRPSEATPKEKAAALKALDLDGTLAEAHFRLAGIKTWADWDWPGAEKAFRRTIELNPNLRRMKLPK